MTSIQSLPPTVTPRKQLSFTVLAKNSATMCVVAVMFYMQYFFIGLPGRTGGYSAETLPSYMQTRDNI